MKSYFVAYDINDVILAYLDSINELLEFTGLRIYDVNYKFKGKTYIRCRINNKDVFIHRFI